MNRLIIDTSTERGIIGLLQEGKDPIVKHLSMGFNQSKFLIIELANLLGAVSPHFALTYIGVGIGPGSYTGLRVGVSVARALAYAWQCPLVGICSLDGFVSDQEGIPFAAVMDAKMGGIYARKGIRQEGKVCYTSEPFVCPLGEMGAVLQGVEELITPSTEAFRDKVNALYPSHPWRWKEQLPSIEALAARADAGQAKPANEPIELLYLREFI